MTEEIIDGIRYRLDEDNKTAAVIKKENGYDGDIIIPKTVVFNERTYCVTSIEYSAFEKCSSLTSIVIPDSVKSIGRCAFRNCESLTSITIPDSVTSIDSETFDTCSSLTSIVVAPGNTVYDSRENCNAIIETRSKSLLYGCQTSLIPNSIKSIGYRAFCGCESLTSITIPNSVGWIEKQAFADCENLTSVTIPDSLTSIGVGAFDCYSLRSITFQGTIAQWEIIESYSYRTHYTTFPFKTVHCTDGDVEI
jgi:hypothetical protein